MLYDGQPFASALVLSHEEQLERLRAAAPQAAATAVLAGDPCFDRLLISRNRRDRYRAALGVHGRRLIMVSSTWWTSSLLGTWPDLIRRLLADLPADSYQVVAALHPNIWHGHGPWQVRSWLGDCLRSGLTLLSEVNGWRAGLIAADLVIGDHGSVTGYGAAIDRPVILAAFPDEDVAAGSPIALLGDVAPRLDLAGSLAQQVEDAIAGYRPGQHADVTSLVTSAPGEALVRLRELFYRLMALPEPAQEPPLTPLPADALTDGTVSHAGAMRVEYTVDKHAQEVRLHRFPAEAQRRPAADEVDVHLNCPADYPLRTLREAAAILTGRTGEPDTWLRETLARHPSCAMAALLGKTHALVRTRDGAVVELRAPDIPEAALPSVLYAWMTTGEDIPPRLALQLGTNSHEVTVVDSG